MKMNLSSAALFALTLSICLLGMVHPATAQEAKAEEISDGEKLIASMEWKEVPTKDLVIEALDPAEGILFFRCDKYRLYFKPKSDDAATRVIALTAIMAEFRQAKSVVISYSTLPQTVSSLQYPFYLPASLMQTGGSYNSAGAFFFRY